MKIYVQLQKSPIPSASIRFLKTADFQSAASSFFMHLIPFQEKPHIWHPIFRRCMLISVYGQQGLVNMILCPRSLSFSSTLPWIRNSGTIQSQVIFGTGGYAVPETCYLGVKQGRKIVCSVLSEACHNGDLTVIEAIEAARGILSQNARKLYKIDAAFTQVSSPKNILSLNRCLINGKGALEKHVSFVRVIWTDICGQCRCRVIPKEHFNETVKDCGFGLPITCVAMKACVDGPVHGTELTGVGEIRLVPDISTLRRIPWIEREGMVLGDMKLTPSEAWEYCPRDALRRVCRVLKDEFNLVLNAGFENEFVLLRPAAAESREPGKEEEWVPVDSTPYCTIAGYDTLAPIFHEFYDALHSLNIPVEQMHAEAGKGQFEMTLKYTTCMLSVDNLIYAREAIRSVSRKHGLLATFVPKYAADDLGSGCHVHLSLSRGGKNVFTASSECSRHGISRSGEEFMAGVLHHLPSIMAITAPIPNSYDRIKPNSFCGAYNCWGKENREAAIRACSPPGIEGGLVSNFEFRPLDGCANPYLGLAAITAAGIDGLLRHLSLAEPVEVNPFILLDGELQRLPLSLSESLEAFEKDRVLEELLGGNLFNAIKVVRKADIDYFSKHKDARLQLIYRY